MEHLICSPLNSKQLVCSRSHLPQFTTLSQTSRFFKCPSLLIIFSFGKDTLYIEGCSNWHWACSICSHQPTRESKSVKSNETYAKWKLLQEMQANRSSFRLTILDPPTAPTVQCE
ncbi:unnamed protein product [Ixodes persulcatus]